MLTSLFGEFGPRRLPTEADLGSTLSTHVVDTDVVVDLDAAQSMRQHFGTSRSDLERASSMITLLDPSGLWAPQVIRALSEAGAQRVERLSLRERGTLRTMAVIERTSVPRVTSEALKVYHAQDRSAGVHEHLGYVLAECSHLTAVIIGSMAPHAVTGLLRELLSATRQPEWQCPWLVFIVPPGLGALRRRILDQDWPDAVRTAAMSESLSGPASVWNAVLTAWEAAAGTPGRPAPRTAPGALESETGGPSVGPPRWLAHVLSAVGATEGVLSCAMVDLESADLLASECADGARAELRQLVAASCAALRAHQAAGGPGVVAPEEILVTMGARQTLLRRLANSQVLGCMVLVERSKANLSLLRYRLTEAERKVE